MAAWRSTTGARGRGEVEGEGTGAKRGALLKTREFSALRGNTRFPKNAWRSQGESNRRPLTGHLKEVPRAMIRLENAEPGSLGAARLPSRAHDAIDPADRRTGNESAMFESGRRNPTKRAARL